MSLAENIKKLRIDTGLPILDCKKALIESENNIENAKVILLEYSKKKAVKLLSREIKVKKIFSYTHNNGSLGILLILGSETDFVINNEETSKLISKLFLNLVNYINKNKEEKNLNILNFLESIDIITETKKIKDILLEAIGLFGENLQILDIKYINI